MAGKTALLKTETQNIGISFKVSLTPVKEMNVKQALDEGFLPVYEGKGKKLAKVNVAGQAFNMLLSKTTTWEPAK